MNRELRVLGWMQVLLLGWMQVLLLGLIPAAPTLMPWGIQALFALSAFQLRMIDRRWALRPGWRGWTSHIRMAPARMLLWAAMAAIAFIVKAGDAAAILIAAMLGELLLYPLLTQILGGWRRRWLAIAMAVVIGACALAPIGACRNIAWFALGVTGCVFWLRGPDGELRSALIALASGLSATMLAIAVPALVPLSFPIAFISLIMALVQTATVRRRPLPWVQPAGTKRCTTGLKA